LTLWWSHSAISYYLQHRAALDAYLRERHERAEALQQEIEARFPPHGRRARLLARRAEGRQG
jgi:hypothetical protein